MNTTIASLVDGIAAAHNLRRRSENRPWAGPCPFCGGSARSDKFQIRDDGGWKCYACGESGDIITWLRRQEGLSCGAAHARAGRQCQMVERCPAAAKCRFGRRGERPASRRRRTMPAASTVRPQGRDIPRIDPQYPPEEFVEWATSLQLRAQRRLLENESELAWLAGRGIDEETATRFGLGWLNHVYYPLRTELGLSAVSKKNKRKVWVPEGLLIPITRGGRIHRLRIRRTPESRRRFSEDLKYYWLRPSGNLPLAIASDLPRPRGAVIVEAELDAMAIAAAHPDVVVVGLGTVAYGIDAALYRYLSALPVILVALDAEQQSIDAVRRWQHTFRYARFWPTPSEKDAGDFFRAGGDLYDWIEAGLPPTPGSSLKKARKILSAGEQRTKAVEAVGGYALNGASEIELKNGVKFYVTADEDIWRQYTAAGLPIFSEGELARIQPLMEGKSDDERLEITLKLIEAKDVFGGYLSASRKQQPEEENQKSTIENQQSKIESQQSRINGR